MYASEPRSEEGLDLGEVVCCAEGGQIALADDGEVGLDFCVAGDAAEFLSDFVELLEFLAEGVRLLLDGRVEHVERSSVLARRTCRAVSRHVLQRPLLGEALVGALAVRQCPFGDGRDGLLLDRFFQLLEVP